jgi:hypothetical protein
VAEFIAYTEAAIGARLPRFIKDEFDALLGWSRLCWAWSSACSSAACWMLRGLSAANLNIHLHCLVLDGVYRSHADGVPEFIEAAAPTEEALHAPLPTVIARLMKRLTRGRLR